MTMSGATIVSSLFVSPALKASTDSRTRVVFASADPVSEVIALSLL
jgi:hypothetical protein